ncbi:thioredoxin domain-containing protein 17 [Rhipicephalus microplus]|uniref:Thioredoxin domain-containing protein 17 n=1 Tax=Rhipicephalus microplus TaxID=6941 RepID=A0A6G5ACV6_RHIMP|nr:thioredoxin domain-containing protein 17-like [Rhipicephalus microplus]
MVKKIVAKSFEEFQAAIKSLRPKDTKENQDLVLCLFTGSEDDSGKSWCPDCVAAKPILAEALEKAPKETTLITCYIERAIWKDLKNPFRTDKSLNLKCVPTLMRWGTAQRLDDTQCQKKDMVEMLLED